MKRINLRRIVGAALLMSGALAAAGALADPPRGGTGPGSGIHPGMMSGLGFGSGADSDSDSGYAMGSGMQGSYGPASGLNLTAGQRSRIALIRDELRHRNRDLMGKLQEEQSRMDEQYAARTRDNAALSASYRQMSALRQQMFDLSLGARRQIDAVLTPEQRGKLNRG